LAGALGSYVDPWRSLAEAAERKRENANRTNIQAKNANGVRVQTAWPEKLAKPLKNWWVIQGSNL
jgi:hypothetical protein